MSCEEYSGWMTEAALGELCGERETELLAHAVECTACREALCHARAVHQFVNRGVAALVAGEPSQQFAAHLRRRIAQESGPLRSPWAAWAPIAAGALALAVVLAIMVAHIPRHGVGNSSGGSDLKTIPVPSEMVAPFAAIPKHAEPTTSGRDANRSVRTRSTAAVFPEIIVPKGQLAAAAQLSAAINSGRVNGNQLLAAQQEYEKPLEVKPIEITPLEIPELADASEKPGNSMQF